MTNEIWVICKENNIIPMIIPANCTDMLQPLDFLWFKTFKEKWQEVVAARRMAYPAENAIPNGLVCGMVKRALDKFGEADIKEFLIKAFADTGLYPPSPENVQRSEWLLFFSPKIHFFEPSFPSCSLFVSNLH